MGEMKTAARQAHDSNALDHAVRLGLVAYGVVHVLIGWLALQLAFGDTTRSASTSGAMHALARQPFGAVLLWTVALGMALLVVWRLLEAWHGHDGEDGTEKLGKQAGSLGKAVIYGVLGVTAGQVAVGDSSGGGTDSMTADLMRMPAGPVIVGAVGLAVIGYGVRYVHRGWTEKFLEHLDAEGSSGDTGTAYRWIGRVGHIAKGIAIGIVGGLFCWAALAHDPQKSGGLDQALHEVAQQPLGQGLLAAVALGIACFGLFCFARARHLSR